MLIGFAGKAGAGKDTAADILISNGVVDRKYSFAEPLKDIVHATLQWDHIDTISDYKEQELFADPSYQRFYSKWHDHNLHSYPVPPLEIYKKFLNLIDVCRDVGGYVSPREAYQIFGTEVCREMLGNNVWIDMTPNNCVIADVRFPNEAAYVKSQGGTLVYIERPSVADVRHHVSESYQAEMREMADCVIKNDSDTQMRLEMALRGVFQWS